jgi:hypothetical protein
MFIAVLFIIAKIQNQPTCPLDDKVKVPHTKWTIIHPLKRMKF